MGQARYRNNFAVTLQADVLDQPLQWNQSWKIFVNSMSDLFHPDVPFEFIRRVFDVMGKANWHTFQILTKRSERVADLAGKLLWHDNVWMGVSVENADYTRRIDHLRKAPVAVRFLSVEPLLGPIPRLPLQGIHWVIVGGESGPGARNVFPRWVRKIRDRCIAQGVPLFFKQWGGTRKKTTGRELDGRTWMRCQRQI
jgi:protein gp37